MNWLWSIHGTSSVQAVAKLWLKTAVHVGCVCAHSNLAGDESIVHTVFLGHHGNVALDIRALVNMTTGKFVALQAAHVIRVAVSTVGLVNKDAHVGKVVISYKATHL